MASPSPSLGVRSKLNSIQDVAQRLASIHASRDGAAFRRIYQVTSGDAPCSVPPELAAKYGLAEDNKQRVICVTNRCL